MKVLHLAAGNRWTGAAAPALAEVEALRMIGIDAHFAYVGGYKLEDRVRAFDFAHPLIEKRQNPATFRRSARSIRQLLSNERFDVVHAHLTWDHLVASFAAPEGVAIARTFHSRRTLRRDPFTRYLLALTDGVCVINERFLDSAAVRSRSPEFTPPPVDHRLFSPDGPSARALYDIPINTPLLGVIGKLAPERGFELAISTLAKVKREQPAARLMIVGHGPHRVELERFAASSGVADAIVWAGYHEPDLPDHYRAMDLMLFTAPGSDEGHRAVLEALASGTPVVSAPIDGVETLLGPLAPQLIAAGHEPAQLASPALALLNERSTSLREACAKRSDEFGFRIAADRLLRFYARITGGDSPSGPLL